MIMIFWKTISLNLVINLINTNNNCKTYEFSDIKLFKTLFLKWIYLPKKPEKVYYFQGVARLKLKISGKKQFFRAVFGKFVQNFQ